MSRHFDQIVRSLTTAGTRRGALSVLAATPLLGGLATLLAPADSGAQGRRKRRKKAHKHGKGRRNKKKTCKAHSTAKTCAGKCGRVKNNCEKPVSCGPCDGDPPCGGNGESCCANNACQGGHVCDNGICIACDVCADGCQFNSVQGAIDAASPAAVIRICPGAYTNNGNAEVANIAEKHLTLWGAGDGEDEASNTILVATSGERVVRIDFSTAYLVGLRITGSRSASPGNGIYISPDSTVNMRNCTVTKNRNIGDPSDGVVNSGGIANNGALTMTNCTVSENATRSAAGGIGNFLGTLTMDDYIVRGNTAGESAAGILNAAGTLTLNVSQVIENTSGVTPAGIRNDAGGTVDLIYDSIVRDNSPGNCGGSGTFNGSGCAP